LNSAYGKLPISFEVNSGQTDMRVKFTAQGKGYRVFLTGNGAVISLHAAPHLSERRKGS
jgi:putative component of toxin-antitoxin plasmid stabilization module